MSSDPLSSETRRSLKDYRPQHDEDHGAALLPGDGLASPATTEALPDGGFQMAGVKYRRSDNGDMVCEAHGTAIDVHCCNCHSGFIFDASHECQDAAGAELRLSSAPRYCPMCDEFMKARVCKACGASTEKVPK